MPRPVNFIEVIPETVGQYICANDENDREIFEGDIIQFDWEQESCWGVEGTYLGFVQSTEVGNEIKYINRQEYTLCKGGGRHPNERYCGVDELRAFLLSDAVNICVFGNIYDNAELQMLNPK